MVCFRAAVASLLLFLAAGPAAAQPDALDLVPEDAALAVVVRNLDELRDKGEAFIKAHEMQLGEEGRPSQLFELAFQVLRVQKGLDRKGAAAVLLPNFEKLGIKALEQDVFRPIVFALPIANLDDMASNFGLKAGELKPGTFHNFQTPAGFPFPADRVLYVRGRHLFLGFWKKAVEAVVESKPVTEALSPLQKATLARADLALHFGPPAWGRIWKDFVGETGDRLKRNDDVQDDAAVEQFVGALRQVRFVVAGLRIQPGLDFDLIASFQKKDAEGAVPFLTVLRGGPGAAELTGLPEHAPLFAYAAKGDGVRNVVIARTMLKIALREVPGLENVLAAADRRKFLGAFETMYQHLKGSRAAIYRCSDPAKNGLLAAVAVLDLDDPDAHLARWADVIEVANNSAGPAARFTYQPKAETLDGRRVDLLTLMAPDMKEGEDKQMKTLLGPDWNRLRIVVLDRGAVLLLGSDRALLQKTVANRVAGSKGLADNPVVKAALAELAPEKKLEFHVSLAAATALSQDPAKLGPVQALTSFAVTIEPDRLQLQIRVPGPECTALLRALKLAGQ
jgi:hypothetical protein